MKSSQSRMQKLKSRNISKSKMFFKAFHFDFPLFFSQLFFIVLFWLFSLRREPMPSNTNAFDARGAERCKAPSRSRRYEDVTLDVYHSLSSVATQSDDVVGDEIGRRLSAALMLEEVCTNVLACAITEPVCQESRGAVADRSSATAHDVANAMGEVL